MLWYMQWHAVIDSIQYNPFASTHRWWYRLSGAIWSKTNSSQTNYQLQNIHLFDKLSMIEFNIQQMMRKNIYFFYVGPLVLFLSLQKNGPLKIWVEKSAQKSVYSISSLLKTVLWSGGDLQIETSSTASLRGHAWK